MSVRDGVYPDRDAHRAGGARGDAEASPEICGEFTADSDALQLVAHDAAASPDVLHRASGEERTKVHAAFGCAAEREARPLGLHVDAPGEGTVEQHVAS